MNELVSRLSPKNNPKTASTPKAVTMLGVWLVIKYEAVNVLDRFIATGSNTE